MYSKLLFWTLIGILPFSKAEAQYRTQINISQSEISADLDLRSIAALFGEVRNLEEFEMRLNDPELQLSNLDLNHDEQVDYLRVVESIEKRTHFILIQAVLDRNRYQDVATITIEKEFSTGSTILIVGNQSLFGFNYFYKPVYYRKPIVFNLIWSTNYRPYYSNWRWNYYPTHYHSWKPYAAAKYRPYRGTAFRKNHYNLAGNRSRYYSEEQNNRGQQRREVNYRNDIRDRTETNTPRNRDRNDDNEARRTDLSREQKQNKPLETKEIENPRRKTQYVEIPSTSDTNQKRRRN